MPTSREIGFTVHDLKARIRRALPLSGVNISYETSTSTYTVKPRHTVTWRPDQNPEKALKAIARYYNRHPLPAGTRGYSVKWCDESFTLEFMLVEEATEKALPIRAELVSLQVKRADAEYRGAPDSVIDSLDDQIIFLKEILSE